MILNNSNRFKIGFNYSLIKILSGVLKIRHFEPRKIHIMTTTVFELMIKQRHTCFCLRNWAIPLPKLLALSEASNESTHTLAYKLTLKSGQL